jgi:hypothetical protein
MARGKKRRPTRTTESYLQSAKQLSKYVPRFKKYKARKTLTKGEKRGIRRKEKLLAGVTDLFPVTKKQARRLKRQKLFGPGVQAIRFRGAPKDAKLRINKRGTVTYSSPTEQWIFWPLDRDTVRTRRGLKKAGASAFEKKFPIEIVKELAAEAFAHLQVHAVHLWTNAGAVGIGFQDFPRFALFVDEKWHAGRYMRTDPETRELKDASDPGLWVNGIAIKLEPPEYQKRRKQHAQAQKN